MSSEQLTPKQARDMALNTMKKAEAERAACAEREAREHACPNCAEKDATIARHVRTTYEIELNRNTRLRQLEYLVEQRDARIAELEGTIMRGGAALDEAHATIAELNDQVEAALLAVDEWKAKYDRLKRLSQLGGTP